MKRLLGLGLLILAASAAAQDRPVPYWASLKSGQAMMRTGPGENYPGIWLYQRRGLPMRVVRRHENWRLVEDNEGNRGWMLFRLLTEQRTGLVTGSSPRPVHAKPDIGSRVRYLAEPGVVGRISDCGEGWCQIRFGSREGHIKITDIWGLDPNEIVD